MSKKIPSQDSNYKEHNISFSTMHTAILHNRKGTRSNGWEIRKGEEG